MNTGRRRWLRSSVCFFVSDALGVLVRSRRAVILQPGESGQLLARLDRHARLRVQRDI